MTRQEVFGKGFRAFQLSGRLGRAKDFQACGLEGVNHANHQRRFRPNDGQTDVMALCKGDQRRNIGGGDRYVCQVWFQRGTGVARCDVNVVCQR
ncbi:hypothetical protein D3C79_1018590 [compost metagenome]